MLTTDSSKLSNWPCALVATVAVAESCKAFRDSLQILERQSATEKTKVRPAAVGQSNRVDSPVDRFAITGKGVAIVVGPT